MLGKTKFAFTIFGITSAIYAFVFINSIDELQIYTILTTPIVLVGVLLNFLISFIIQVKGEIRRKMIKAFFFGIGFFTFYLLWAWLLRLLCGYGEKPKRVIIWSTSVIFGLALAYYFWGSFVDTKSFANTLYYSVASFTALGYGQWAPQPTGWAQGMGAVEAVIGVFSMALFLVTFTRKMTR